MGKRLWREMLDFKWLLVLAAGYNAAGSILFIGQAFCFAVIINGIFLENKRVAEVLPYFYSLGLVVTGRALFSYGAQVKALELAAKITAGLRERLTAKIFAAGPVHFGRETSGDLTNLLADAPEKIEPYFSRFLPQILETALTPFFILVVVFALNKYAFFILLVTAPLIPAFMILIGKAAKEKNRAQFAKLSAMNMHFLDVLQGLATLKLFGRSKEQAKVIARVSQEFQDSTLSVLKIAFLSSFALEIVATIGTAFLAVTVGLEVLYGYSQFREAFFVLLLTPGFYLPFRQLGAHYHAAQEAVTASEKIYALLDRQVESSDAVHLPFAKTDKISLSFENVSFTYDNQFDAALKEINFQVKAGEKIALIGHSGAGKSTIAALLLKFTSCQSGTISVNGVPLWQINKNDWLANIAYVPQRPHLFAASIAANIRSGSDAPLADVINAAQKAHLHEFITSLPQGYDTLIGEGGRSLSGGETQRLAVARAFLKNASLIIFDEAAAALDAQNETAITETAWQLFPDSTIIFITHRLKNILACDRAVLLKNGRVAGEGTLEKGGRLWREILF